MISYDACNKYERITHSYLIILTLIGLAGGGGGKVPKCPPSDGL